MVGSVGAKTKQNKTKSRWKPEEKKAWKSDRIQMEIHRDKKQLPCNSGLAPALVIVSTLQARFPVSTLRLPGQQTGEEQTDTCSLKACMRWLPSLACAENFPITVLMRISSLFSINQHYTCHSLHSLCITFILFPNLKDLYSLDEIELLKNPI